MACISVVLSNYNGAKYIGAALDSIFAQDFDDYEVIVVDDASTDDSVALVSDYVERYPEKLRQFVHECNRGQAEGFNTGLQAARGEIVALMDADDLWYPNKLSGVWRYFELAPSCVMVQHNLYLRYNDQPSERRLRSFLPSGNLLDFAQSSASAWPSFLPTAGLAIRREALLKTLPIPAKFRTCADGYITRTVMTLGPIGFVDECWGEYRIHDGNNTCENPHFDQIKFRKDDLVPALNDFYAKVGIALRFVPDEYNVRSKLLRDYLDVHKRAAAALLRKVGFYDPPRALYRRLKGRESLADVKNRGRIAEYKGRHKGRRAFILGMGPSLRIADLDKLHGEITFACNKIFLAFEETDWRPSYYSVLDVLVARNNASAIAELNLVKFFSDSCRQFFKSNEALWLKSLPSPVNDQGERIYSFSEDVSIGVYGGFTVVYLQLQLAWFMGIREVYLVGLDFDFKVADENRTQEVCEHGEVLIAQGEVNHFHPDYRKKGETWTVPQMDKQRLAFQKSREFFEKNGGNIYNASRETKLDVFERVAFEELV